MGNRKNKTKLGLILRCIRIAQEKSVKDVALGMDVSSTYITEVENGNKTPSYDMLKQFAKYFEFPASKIIEIEENAIAEDLQYPKVLLLCVEYECMKNKNNNLEESLSK
ncbi:MAG: helix-turn-helix domain-containing protein [Clostridia bacterium]